MEYFLIALGLVLVGSVLFLLFQIQEMRKGSGSGDTQKLMLEVVENLRKSMEESGHQHRKTLQESLDKLHKQLDSQQHRSLESFQKQFGQSAKMIEDVTKKLTKLDETNKQVVGFAEQMQSLENILKNPKQRGILGEYFLEQLLGNVLAPGQYQMQYAFQDGNIVDAVIFSRDKIIPIDAKFSLEKYNKLMQENDPSRRETLEKEFKSDLKKRIDETAKYIRPSEKTTDFSLMFIPAEGVYYNLLVYNVGSVNVNTQDLVEYAFRKHVIIVSPTSFFAYLETVLHGLKALKMEESIQEVMGGVDKLAKHLRSYETYMGKVGSNLSTTLNMYNNAAAEWRKIDKDVYKITDGAAGGQTDEVQLLEKPTVETFQ